MFSGVRTKYHSVFKISHMVVSLTPAATAYIKARQH